MANKLYTQEELEGLEIALKKNPADSMNYVRLAEAQLSLHKDTQAFSTYRAAKVLCPDEPAVMYVGARILESLGKKEEAIDCLQKAILAEGDIYKTADSVSHLAELLYNSGKRDKALEWLNKLIKLSNDRPDVLMRLAQIHLSLGNTDEAQNLLKKYRDIAGPTREMFMLMGQTMLSRKFYDGAVKNYNDAVRNFPDDADMHLGLGKAWIGMEEKGTALKELTTADSLKPNDVNILLELGKLQNSMGMGECANETFAKVEAFSAENGEAMLELGRYFIGLNNDVRGLRCLEIARKLSPYHSELLKLIGQTEIRLKKFDSAFDVFSSAVVAEPKAIWAHEGVVASAGILEKYKEKAESQKALLGLRTSSAEDWCDYAETLIRLGKFKDAEIAFEKAAKLDHTCLRAYQAPELIKLEKSRAEGEKIALQGIDAAEKHFYATATEKLQKALSLVPRHQEWSKQLAKVCLKTAEVEKASQLLSDIRSVNSSDFQTGYDLARTYEYLNNFQMATELLSAITKDNPLDFKAHLMLLRLKRSQIRGTRGVGDMLEAIVRNLDADFLSIRQSSPISLIVKGYAYYLFASRSNFVAEGIGKAEMCFKEAISSFGERPDAVMGLALCERMRGNVEKAVEYTREWVNLGPETDRLLVLARLRENFGLYSDARKDYETLRDCYPSNGFFRRKYVEMTAMLQTQTGKSELTQLLSDASKRMLASSTSVWPVFETAIGQEMASHQGNLSDEWLKRASLNWRKAEAHPDTNQWVIWEMVRCQLKNLKGIEKQRMAKSLLAISEKNIHEMPDQALAWATMARCCLGFNDLTNKDKALNYLCKAWFIDSSYVEIGEMLAETAKGLGKSVMVDLVGYNVILSEPELANNIFRFQ